MLRTIISLYKAVFLILCALVAATFLGFGFYEMIEGPTPKARWDGVSLMVFGTIFVVVMAGNFALVIENNELLRRIAEQTAREQPQGQLERAKLLEQRAEPRVQRREPTL